MADSSNETHPTHLSPSELGTKEYWESFYTRTLTHISSKQHPSSTTNDPETHADEDNDDDQEDYNVDSDPGTSWFSEHNAPQKVLDFLTGELFPLAPCNTLPAGSRRRTTKRKLTAEEKAAQPSVLDLGTGNGSMLALLRKRGGFKGELVGVDYSGMSVQLARELQESRGHEAYQSDSDDESEFEDEEGGDEAGNADGEEEWDPIVFEEYDILGSEEELAAGKVSWFPYKKGGFDIVLDKGTFDAVSLMTEKKECERYPGIAGALVRKGGFLVVTSCNWTEEEVVRWFTEAEVRSVDAAASASASASGKLVVWGKVQYPRFKFGGQEGQGVCTVCFQRV
ncbi:methyltransferase domain-containing protein [Aspergillus karnatakaensis]|uniref:putative S-adenosylmethionine-dependent methyltransferase n=1 Tax=Aspergillus karnatakaensis TaxID=1810916 RepID=UPI003CCCE709